MRFCGMPGELFLTSLLRALWDHYQDHFEGHFGITLGPIPPAREHRRELWYGSKMPQNGVWQLSVNESKMISYEPYHNYLDLEISCQVISSVDVVSEVGTGVPAV